MLEGRSCQNTVILRAAEPAPSQPIHINSGAPHAFETDAFTGRVALWIAGLPDSPADLFSGKKRRSYLVIQVTQHGW